MTVLQLLQQCQDRDIILRSDAGNLVVKAPEGALDDTLRTALRRLKGELLSLVPSDAQANTPPLRPAGQRPPSRFSLSAYQRQFWAGASGDNPDNTTLAIAEAFDFDMPVRPDALRFALERVAARHDMLRMRLETDEHGEPVQVIRDRVCVPLTVRELHAGASEDDRAEAVRGIIGEAMAAPYDLGCDTPFRAGLVTGYTGEGGATVVLGIPHIVGDALSLNVILRDLVRHLQGGATADADAGAPPPVQYGEYVRWLDANVSDDEAQRHVDFWADRLRDLPPVHALPTDHARPVDRRASQFAFVDITLPDAAPLNASLRRQGVSPFIFFQTAMRIALYRFGGVTGIPVATPMANRHRFSALDSAVGCFANEVVLHIPLDPDATVRQAMDDGQVALADALEHQEAPFNHVLERLNVPRSTDWLPVAQVFYSYVGLAEDVPVRHRFDHIGCPGYDLSFTVADCKDHYRFMLGFDTALYDFDTMRHLGALFTRLCSLLPAIPDATPRSITLTDALPPVAERNDKTPNDALTRSLFTVPGETICILDDESESPCLMALGEMARGARCDVDVVDASGWMSMTGPRTLLTSRPPHELAPLMRPAMNSANTDSRPYAASGEKEVEAVPRLCLVDHLPSAAALRALCEWGVEGHVVVRLLPARDGEPPRCWVASLRSLQPLRDDDRFVEGDVMPTLPPAMPGERLTLAPGLHLAFGGQGRVRLPLPDATVPVVWFRGRRLHLDLLADAWARAQGVHAAFTLQPDALSPLRGDRLTAWIVRGDEHRPSGADTRVPGMPEGWPERLVDITALPLTSEGGLDRHALSRLPQVAEAAFPDIERSFIERGRGPLNLLAVAETPPARVLHHSDIVPQGRNLTVRSSHSMLGVAARKDGDGDDRPLSIVYGTQLGDGEGVSFRECLERFRNELVFIDLNGAEERFSGTAFLERARTLLSGLQCHGLKPGVRAILYCPDERDILSLAWACLLGGIDMTALLPPRGGQNPAPTQTRLGHMLDILGAPVVITTPGTVVPFSSCTMLHVDDLLAEGREVGMPELFETRPDSPVYTAFTSGSTGVPKAVPLNAANLFAVMRSRDQRLGPIADETALSITSLDHVGSLFGQSLFATMRGARQVYSPFPYVLADPVRVLDIMHRHRVSHTWAPDFLWRHLYESLNRRATPPGTWDLSSMTHLISGGENTREATFVILGRQLAAQGLDPAAFSHCWGMSETSSFFTMSDAWDGAGHESHLGIVDAGPPLPGMAFRTVDRNGETVPEGVLGAFHVSGPSVFGGYLDNPEANAESFSPDGWFITGDIAMIRNGRVIFCGREKEQVVINGQNISQFDIEGFVDGIEGVEPTFSVVIGCRNEATGDEDVLVFAHTTHVMPSERAAVIRRISAALNAHYGIMPRHVLLVDKQDVPKAALGKIQRVIILKRFIAGEFQRHVRESDLLLQNADTVPDWFVNRGWTPADLPPWDEVIPLPPASVYGIAHDMTGACNDSVRTAPSVNLHVHHSLGISEDLYDSFRPSGKGHLVLMGHDMTLSAALGRQLGDFGAQVEEAHSTALATSHEAATSLAATREGATMVYMAGREPHGEARATWLEFSFMPLVRLMSAMAESPSSLCGRSLVVVTTCGQYLAGEGEVSPMGAALAALATSLGRLVPGVRVVDLHGERLEDDAEALRRELLLGTTEQLCAWRSGRRHVPCLQRVDFRPDAAAPGWDAPFAPGTFCLCTGFTGRLGRVLLPQLLALTRGRFLLVGRRTEDEAARALPHILQGDVPHWQERVLYVQAGLDDPQALETALRRAGVFFAAEDGRPVPPGGVLHLAADTSEHDFSDFAAEMLVARLDERLRHLGYIEEAFARCGGTGPRVVFSSVMSLWGGARSALYAPSCAVAEAFAAYRASTPEGWRCFGWSRWQDADGHDDYLASILKQRGFLMIDPRRGALSLLAMLARTSHSGEVGLLAGVEHHAPGVACLMRRPGHSVRPVMGVEAHVAAGSPLSVLRGLLVRAVGRGVNLRVVGHAAQDFDGQGRLLVPSSGGRHADEVSGGVVLRNETHLAIERRMLAIWRDVLQLGLIDPSASFFELGGTSVHVPRLREKVLAEFGVDVGSVGVFHYPSVYDMSHAVAGASEGVQGGVSGAAVERAARQRSARAGRGL